jgi:hypothetical protein
MDLSAVSPALYSLLGAVFNLSHPGHFIHWHWINLSVANVIVIGLMIVTFIAAILIPFPKHKTEQGEAHD